MSMDMKFPRKHTVRLSDQTSEDVIEEAKHPDVDIHPSVLMRELIDEGIAKRKRARRAQKGKV